MTYKVSDFNKNKTIITLKVGTLQVMVIMEFIVKPISSNPTPHSVHLSYILDVYFISVSATEVPSENQSIINIKHDTCCFILFVGIHIKEMNTFT